MRKRWQMRICRFLARRGGRTNASDMDATITEGFISLKEFAGALRVSEERVRAWIRDGVLPVVRLGRLVFIPKDALRRMLERQEVRA